MSETAYPIASSPTLAPGLTQTQRVIYTFTAPSKTFRDILRNNSWWLPFVLTVIFSGAMFFAVQSKVGFEQVAENNIRLNPKQAAQVDKLPADQRATQMKITVIVTKVIFAIIPIFAIIVEAIVAGVLLATINFGFGGKAQFWQVFAVGWYAGLPRLIKIVMAIIALYAGMAPESFNSQNPAGTNPGFYLPPETSKALLALATSIDVVTIWSLVLLSIGLAIVAGTKRSSGYIAVFGWWLVVTLAGVGWAAAFS